MTDKTTAERDAAQFTACDMATASAQGFRDGRASLPLPGAQEAVARDGWLHENGLLYRLTDERRPSNRDEISVTMADGSRSVASRSRRALELLDVIRAQAPQPALSAGWVSVKDRLPPPFDEVWVHPRPSDYCCEASVDTVGNWKYSEYETNFGVNHIKCTVEYWMQPPALPVEPSMDGESK